MSFWRKCGGGTGTVNTPLLASYYCTVVLLYRYHVLYVQ
mgnify:CR=1 FL=1